MSDLFANANNTETPVVSEGENPVELLVGEGKKFKTVEELALGKLESDRFIQRLQEENRSAREELLTLKRLEEVVDKLASGNVNANTQTTQTQTNHNDEGERGNREQAPADIEDLVAKTLEKREQEKRQKDNIDEVARTLTEAWGPGFANKLVAEAAALGMSKEEVNALAARNPRALYKLVGVGTSQTKGPDLFSTPSSQVNTTGFKPNTGERGKSYYDKLRRENPSLYYSTKIQQQEYQDAMRLGDRFFQS